MDVYSEYSDQELVQLLVNDDENAFDRLYERHWFQLYQSAFYFLKDKDASKDIVQDVFLWIWQKRSTLNITNVKAYLKAAVRFKVANYIRSGNIRDSFYDEVSKVQPNPTSPTGDDIMALKQLQIDQTVGSFDFRTCPAVTSVLQTSNGAVTPATSCNGLAVQFDIYMPVEWSSGFIRFEFIKGNSEYRYHYAPWAVEGNVVR